MNNEPQNRAENLSGLRRADLIHRYLAKFIDGLIVLALVTILPGLLGFLCALTYLLIADGFSGKSPGKRLIGLITLETSDAGLRPCRFKASLVRNSPLGLALFLSSLPILNIILIPTAVLLIIAGESYFILTDERGARLGDIFASTRVVEEESKK